MTTRLLISAWIRWAWTEWQPAWAAVALLASAGMFVIVPNDESAVRVWGMVLQLLGIGAVIHDLRSTNKHYMRRGIRDSARHAWNKRPGASKGVKIAGMSATALANASARAVLQTNPANLTIAERIDILERRTTSLQTDLADARAGLDKERAERQAADHSEAQSRMEAISDLDRRIEGVIAGAVSVSMLGVWALGLGVILASAAGELLVVRGWVFGG